MTGGWIRHLYTMANLDETIWNEWMLDEKSYSIVEEIEVGGMEWMR